MGCVKTIDYNNFPKQKDDNYKYPSIGKKVRVCYHYNTNYYHYGIIVRDDIDEPFETIIKLDNGRYVRGVECQYSFVDDDKYTVSEMRKLYNPCRPCLCPGAPCEQCMFGYKSQEEASRLLKHVLDNNTYPGIVERYNLYHKNNV